MAGAADGIDWTAPWFEPWREAGETVAHAWRSQPLHAALNTVSVEEGAPEVLPPRVRFVAQEALADSVPYEAHIFATGTCPTRDNLHDFFNGLCWLRFARSKGALNRLQAAEIERCGTTGPRGRVRDAITVFDENGALLHAPDALWDALVQRQWQRLFIDLRPLWKDARVVIFGHALLEKLLDPRKDLTAHVWRTPMGPSEGTWDTDLAGQLTAERLAEKPFTPLPVLGVPGWTPANRDFSFYDDALVFRPAGRQNNTLQARAVPRLT